MLYDPVNNLPFPCDSETKPSKRNLIKSKRRILLRNLFRRAVVKRGDGDSIPIKLQPCPFPNGTQEHRWLKSTFDNSVYIEFDWNDRVTVASSCIFTFVVTA